MSLQEIADCMKAGLSSDASNEDAQKFLAACKYTASDLEIDYWIDSGASISTVQVGMLIRGAVMERIGRINEVLRIALSRGYLLPDSPFPIIENQNQRRSLFQPIEGTFNYQITLQNAARELSKVAKAYDDGKVTFDRKPAAQLGSYEVSVDGISDQSGDPLSDILGYQPDGDFVKRKRALDSLSKLDFSKRKPYLLFTLESSQGIVVCWGKMRDASGYSIGRRDVFAAVDLPPIIVSNQDLEQSTSDLLRDDRFYQALSFYDWTGPGDVYAIVDPPVSQDTLYSYRVSGMQKKAPASPFIFDVPMNALLFSPALMERAQAVIQEEAGRFNRSASSISPYPAISQAVYGDPSFGWIIAGCNVLASVRRGDSVDSVRSNSYIGSTAERILSEAKAGRLFVPSDISKVQASVEAAVSSYGVSQAVLSILDGTGVTNFVSGKDDPRGIVATQASIEGSTAGLARILAVIDPETATLDPNLINVSGQTQVAGKFVVAQISQSGGGPSFDEIVGEGVIDLTTYSGLGRFMQLLRIIYDFYPGAFT